MRAAAWMAVAAMAVAVPAAHAEPLEEKDVPEPLKPWIGWVLEGQEAARCPFFHGNADRRTCAWPATLALELDDGGGRFTQDWLVDATSTVALPGEAKRWPLDVRVDGRAAPVIDRGGLPAVRLETGTWRVTGSFSWDRLPEMLQVPADTGIVSLTVRGRRVDFPSRDEQGRLWLQREQTSDEGETRLEVLVHRKVTDDIPLTLTTDVVLKVSGRNREVLLGRSLPDGFVPMSLTGPLPARIERDGRLRVQVRPGTWRIALVARHVGPTNEITCPPLAENAGAWDGDEAWVFEARPALRLVSVEGVPGIDAQQTELPDAWRSLPAYLVQPGDTMKLVQRQRGDEKPAPDRLSLDRTWWLDFDGTGWTVQDRIGGTLSSSWRLEMGPETVLGRAAVDGRDQFITHLDPDAPRGIEVRQSQVSLEADSRIEKRASTVPAVSWTHDFESVGGRVNLPPGWRLLHAFGVDRASPTWIAEWDLLDLFLLLVIALSIGKLWGVRWGALALVTLGLAWHEPGAPRWVWLFLLVGEALYRVLPAGAFKALFRFYRWTVWGVLVLLTVPFLVLQVRNALYPQLEPTWNAGWLDRLADGVGFPGGVKGAAQAPMEVPAPATVDEGALGGEYEADGRFEALEEKAMKEIDSSSLTRDVSKSYRQKPQGKLANVYAPDPRAQVSTGPGLPSWTWRSVSLSWRGPVDAEQRIRFVLVPPWLHVLLSVARTVLTAVLVLLVLGFPVASWLRGRLRTGATATTLALALLAVVLPASAHAQEPSKETLAELQRRLLEKPECAPSCATIGRMRVEVSGSTLRARLEVSAAAETAVPLPGGAQQWSAGSVFLDGSPARGLFRSSDGVLWIPLQPGAHQVVVEGPLPDRETVQVPLPLKPRHVQASVSGWILDGIHEDGQPDDTLQLTRTRGAGGAAAGLQQETLPPFLRVERDVRFDLSWEVTTRVSRVTPPGAAVVVEVPLLPGESVTSADLRVHDGRAAVSMGPTVSHVEWTSVLADAETIVLTATTSSAWSESWRVDASPIWHVEPSGIPPVQRPATAERLREWRPWPGEAVTLAISRPEGAPGQTLTIDGASISVSPGLRATDATLSLTLRSSRGGQHAILLPEGAELQSVAIDGTTQPVRLEDGRVTLPVSPGRHGATITWRQPGGIRLLYRTPKVDLGAPAVNAEIRVQMPNDRWTLFLSGPRLGPAVLFWSLLAIYFAISLGLGQLTLTPLRWWHWFLLGLGLTQVPIPVAAIVAAWLLTLGARAKRPPQNPALFDLLQLALPFFTLLAIGCLFASIAEGLLGMPEMQIRGNGSWATTLAWFQDRVASEMPRARIVSVPLMVYRLAMLGWALWLAWSLLKWLRWAWACFTSGGAWKSLPPRPPKAPATPAAPPT